MNIRTAVAPALLLLLAACSGAMSSAERPAPVDPVGFYDFTASVGGDVRSGTLEIVRTPAGLDAEAYIEGEGTPALADSVHVDGSHVVLYMLVGGGDAVTLDLRFDGAAFEGNIIVGLDSFPVSGRRRASQAGGRTGRAAEPAR